MSLYRRSISQASSHNIIKSSTSYVQHNWFFLKKNIKRPKTKKICQYYSTFCCPAYKAETEKPFINTSISFTSQEKQLLEIAKDRKLQNLYFSNDTESRIDIAKSMHTLSVINLNKEREIAEEKDRKTKEEKKKVVDEDELFSTRNTSYPNVEAEVKVQQQDDGTTKFITEMSEEQIKVQEMDKDHLKELIQDSLEIQNGCQYENVTQYRMGCRPNIGERKVKRAVEKSCYSQEVKSVSPYLNTFPNPYDQNTFAIKKMRNMNHQ